MLDKVVPAALPTNSPCSLTMAASTEAKAVLGGCSAQVQELMVACEEGKVGELLLPATSRAWQGRQLQPWFGPQMPSQQGQPSTAWPQ